MISVDEARAAVLERIAALPPESISVADALGRVLAADVKSTIDVPPYTKSMMDGFAIDAKHWADGSITAASADLTVVEEVSAGDLPKRTIGAGEAARIMTGAPLPAGANTVVRFEDSSEPKPGLASIKRESVVPGRNVLDQGSILSKGDRVLEAGRKVSGIDLGLLAEVSAAQVAVRRLPKVAVLATGDELVPVGESLGPGQIRNSNGPMLCGLVNESHGIAQDLGIGRDNEDALTDLVAAGLECDALILSGGVSAGDKDLVPGVLQSLGVEQVFHKVRLRPGKPIWFGICHRRDINTGGQRVVPVFGLPGNPVSSYVGFSLFVRPALLALGGCDKAAGMKTRGVQLAEGFEHLDELMDGPRARETYFPGRVVQYGAVPSVAALPWKGSADLANVAAANCLVRFPAGQQQFALGDELTAVWF